MIDAIILSVSIILIILLILLKTTKVPKQVYKSKAVYSDHKEKPAKALYSERYKLAGKPDFILHTKDGLIPLEIKHTNRPKQPYFSHVMQLVSYCLLMEEQGNKPRYGFLQYRGGKAFYIPYTENMKSFLLKTMDEMREYIAKGESPTPIRKRKCETCSYKCFG